MYRKARQEERRHVFKSLKEIQSRLLRHRRPSKDQRKAGKTGDKRWLNNLTADVVAEEDYRKINRPDPTTAPRTVATAR